MRFTNPFKFGVIARPVRLLQMPLLWRTTNEAFEPTSQVDRDSTHVVTKSSFTNNFQRRFNYSVMTSSAFEIDSTRNERSTSAQCESWSKSWTYGSRNLNVSGVGACKGTNSKRGG
jgi:hypothetical protein